MKNKSERGKNNDPYTWVKNRIISLHNNVKNFSLETNDKEFTGNLGVWSVKKLIALNYYIKPFVKIIKSKKYNFKNCYYVDPFCGSGLFKINNKIFPGSPLVSLFNEHKFDRYYLSDEKQTYITSLQKRIKLRFNSQHIDIRNRDCNERLAEIFEDKSSVSLKEDAYLVFLDPYGFDLKWEIMETILQSGAVDIILTFMTSQINRNKRVSNSKQKLNTFFGSEEWKSLFKPNDFVNYYCSKIREHGDHYSRYKTYNIGIYNFKGTRYDLILATKSRGGANVMDDLQKRIDPIDTNLLNSAFNVGIERGVDLDSYID